MNKLGTKTLKILLFIGVFSYLQYYDVKRGAFSVNSITGGHFCGISRLSDCITIWYRAKPYAKLSDSDCRNCRTCAISCI